MQYGSRLHSTLLILSLLLAACDGGSGGGSGGGAASPPSSQARDDMAVTSESEAVTIDVLANDSDSGGGPLSLDSFAEPSNSGAGGTLTLNDNGTPDDGTDDTLTYTPGGGTDGYGDSFTYRASNARGSSGATVRIVVEDATTTGACTDNQSGKAGLGQRYCVETTFQTPSNVPGDTGSIQIALQLFVPNRDALRANTAAMTGSELPAGSAGFSPLLIQGHGYGGNKLEDLEENTEHVSEQVILDAWKRGYWVISFTQRGFADNEDPDMSDRSGGQIGLMSPALEGLDFVRLVDWAICHIRHIHRDFDFVAAHGTDTSFADDFSDCPAGESLLASDSRAALLSVDDDVALGTIGYSYGGGFQPNAQSVDPRVDAMIPMDTWFDLRYSLHPNDTPKTTWVGILTEFTLDGGNEQPPPPFIAEGNAQINGANTDPNDEPYNKARQVSIPLMNDFGPHGPVAYCDGNASEYAFRTGDSDGEPVVFPDPLPVHATDQRSARADMLMIQGLGDTLFNFNEGYDIARCFSDQNSDLDVRFIAQLSGHPLPPPLGPPHYGAPDAGPTGTSASFYLDEVIHCGRDANGHPQRYNLREVGLAWFDDKLRGVVDVDDIFPHRLCIVQPNTDTTLVLDTSDPFLHIANTGPNAYQFPIEGIVGDDLGDVPIGSTTFFADFETKVATGTAVSGDTLTSNLEFIDQSTFHPLPSLSPSGESRVMAGIPLIELKIVDRQNELTDEIFYVGVAVKREGTARPELIQFQATPVRVVPPPAAVIAADAGLIFAPGLTDLVYPKNDPRNFVSAFAGDEPHFYPIRWGDNPGASGFSLKGRLPGISTRLNDGDIVGLLFMPEHPAFTTMTSIPAGPSSITVRGTVELPIQPPTVSPSDLLDFNPG